MKKTFMIICDKPISRLEAIRLVHEKSNDNNDYFQVSISRFYNLEYHGFDT